MAEEQLRRVGDGDIAVVGMAVRVPGADDVGAYWDNLRSGLSSIRKLSDDELRDAGVPDAVSQRPDYVPYAAPLDGFAEFDAEFFGLSPKEAAIMDPQHRQFLEVSWEAMEHAGHPPESVGGNVGVYAGCGMGSYFYFNVCSHRDLVRDTGMFLLRHTGNDKDFMATRASHVFDLNGPSIGLQTACSTSLVAIHYAAKGLQNGECDMALAGGVTIELPQGQGYQYKKDEILSPDGTCRAFDHRAEGTVFGSGAGVVVLRRLEDAVADGDHIWAVLKGSAVNNDGAVKASYLAPSVEGQSKAVEQAHRDAGVDAGSVGYVECHGTGTYLGDPIEVAALTEAFRKTTLDTEFCRIGSVKTNIGHLDTAAGVASFVKASLALHNEAMPPSLNFEAPNPAIAFEGSPFSVNAELTPWPRGDVKRFAGVNSLGVGGTNAHVVLEEPPAMAPSDESDWPFQPLVLSARSKAALDQATGNLAGFLRGEEAEYALADIAFTLKEGRRAFDRRRVVVAETAAEAADLLEAGDPRRVFNHTKIGDDPDVVFMFPGGGAQYAGMARDLYATEPVFRDWMDKGLAVLDPKIDFDIRDVWLPDAGDEAAADARLQAPSVQLPLIMICEYALAQLWMSWGVQPSALIGHSMGENTAACLAGVMTLEDCVELVLLRGRLFETVEPGGMLSVPLSEEDLRPRLGDALDIASVNAPGLCVVSGPQGPLDQLADDLAKDGVDTKRIPIDIAAHSRLLEPILEEFGAYLRSLDLQAPKLPIVSNRTGDWLTDDEATDPEYWVQHLRNTIRFKDGLETLSDRSDRIFLEVGPGVALASLASQQERIAPNQVIGTLRHPEDEVADDIHFMGMLARVWAVGGAIDWSQIWSGARRHRVPMPTYPFQHQRYFIERNENAAEIEEDWLSRIEDRDDWAWEPVWKPEYADCSAETLQRLGADDPKTWLLFEDGTGLARDIADTLRGAGHRVVLARPGDAFAKISDEDYLLAVERGQDSFDSLIAELKKSGHMPDRLGHFWLVTGDETARPGSSFFHRVQEQGFWALYYFARAWAAQDCGDLHIVTVTSEAASVGGEGLKYPEKTTSAGPAKVIPREFPGMTCSRVDVAAPTAGRHAAFSEVLEELLAEPGNSVAAIRDGRRYVRQWRRAELAKADGFKMVPEQVVLITGGLGGIGLTLAEQLVKTRHAKVALLSRRAVPPRDRWQNIVDAAPENDRMGRKLARLIELSTAGDVAVFSGDVSNVEDMERVVDEVRSELGPIAGVVHAAGVIDDAPILTKNSIEIGEVLAPKVHGAQVLLDVFGADELDWVVLFSSSSTVTAPAGQVDYVAANEYLNALAATRRDGRTKVKTIAWGPWSDVGMAVDALDEANSDDTSLVHGEEAGQPLLNIKLPSARGDVEFLSKWRADTCWVLDEHRTTEGDALLPGTGYIELAAQAMAANGDEGAVEIENLTFLSPLRAPDGEDVSVRVTLAPGQDGSRMTVMSAVAGEERVERAEAVVRVAAREAAQTVDLGAIEGRCAKVEASVDGYTPQHRHLRLGQNWQVTKSRAYGANEGLAVLEIDGPDTAFLAHPGLLDIATGFGLPLVEGYQDDQFWVPLSYSRIRLLSPIPSKIVSWLRSDPKNNAERDTATFDITIATPDGQVVAEIDGFVMHRLATEQSFASSGPQGAGQDAPVMSEAELRLRQMVAQGIPAQDGAEMFMRAMATDAPHVLVTSTDLNEMIAQADRAAEADAAPEAEFERPQLESDFVEPANDIERRLAEFWTDLLGISEIGVEDNFFDLGGHSLIAVRLFAKVKAAFQVDFPISVLFEAPTIRKCADMIAERVGADVDLKVVASSDDESDAPDYRYVVPMNAGKAGSGTPFFMVAGMFGNVLNLRHLAHLTGVDRPFYGLQAKGLYGGVEPHDSLVDAARDYIEEIRLVQPKGPYLLGGFSGGGLTALEIAHQLQAAGETVAELVMLDTPLPRPRKLTGRDRLVLQYLRFREVGLSYPFTWVRNRIRWEFEKRNAPQYETDESEFHNVAIKEAFYRAIGSYEVHRWGGPMTLLRPPLSRRYEVAPGRFIDGGREYVDPSNEWDQYVPNLKVIEVPGDHDSMVLEPNVRVLAARIRTLLDAAETKKTKTSAEKLRAAE